MEARRRRWTVPWMGFDLCNKCSHIIEDGCEGQKTGTRPPSYSCWAWEPDNKQEEVRRYCEETPNCSYEVGEPLID